MRESGELLFRFGDTDQEAVAHQVECQHRGEDGDAGEGDHPPGAQNELPCLGQHGAPFRGRRLGANAEEAEGGGTEDGGGEAERRMQKRPGR